MGTVTVSLLDERGGEEETRKWDKKGDVGRREGKEGMGSKELSALKDWERCLVWDEDVERRMGGWELPGA